MSKKIYFSFFFFAILFSFVSCTDSLSSKTQTDINLNIDLSKILRSARNEGENQHSQTVEVTPVLEVAIYNAQNYNATSNSPENLTLITQAKSNVSDGVANVKLIDIPVGINAIVFAELSFSNGTSTEVMYSGNSDVFRVKSSDNKVSLVLKKVGDSDDLLDVNVPFEMYTLYKKSSSGEEVSEVNLNEASITSDTEKETTVSVVTPDNSDSVWTYFVHPVNNFRFTENGNYKVSVDLKAGENTTVVGIAAARADYFFTVNSDWTTCEFETGYIQGSDKHQFTIGLGLSSEIQIKNLKIEKLEENTTLPSLVFDISKHAINEYLQYDRVEKIVEVTRDDSQDGYNITINAPLSHSESLSDGETEISQDVNFHLRSYATDKLGANRVAFNMSYNDEESQFYTSYNADTASPNSNSWNNTPTTEFTKDVKIDFPNYVENDELTVDVITTSESAVTSPVSFTISNFGVKSVTDDAFSDKIFVIKTKKIDDNGSENYIVLDSYNKKVELDLSIHSSYEFDVLMFNKTDDDNGFSPTNDDWAECTRFIYSGEEQYIAGITGLNYTGSGDANDPKFNLEYVGNSDCSVKIGLDENYNVVIEDSSSSSGGD